MGPEAATYLSDTLEHNSSLLELNLGGMRTSKMLVLQNPSKQNLQVIN